MAKVIINAANGERYESKYEYVEGGFEEDGTPGFHIAAGANYVYVYFKNKEEFKHFLKELKDQIPVDEE